MLCALYQEQMHEGVDDFLSFRQVADDYDIEWREGWLLDLQKSLISNGFLRGPSNGSNDDMAIGKLIGGGLRYIEDKHGTLDGVPTMILKKGHENMLVVETDRKQSSGPFDPAIFDPAIFDTGQTVASSSWTGLPRTGTLSSHASERLKVALKTVDDAIAKASCSNEERAQARAYVLAIHALAEAPDPPADLIWKLVERANSIAGIASFFISLVALFAHA
jgi:hypothetical protein